MQKTILVKNLSDIDAAAKNILEFCSTNKKIAFYGEMGSGKTTLIKAMCKALGVTDDTSSPTFSIVNEYSARNKEKIFHFDFYRIEKETEAYDLGYEDYFYSNAYCFIEWPEKIPNLIPEKSIKLKIEVQEGGERLISICEANFKNLPS